MKGPIDAARQQRKRRRYPHGKALARIQYFDKQRGMKPGVAAPPRINQYVKGGRRKSGTHS
jgi:hypothetical protein